MVSERKLTDMSSIKPSEVHVAPARESLCSVCATSDKLTDNHFYWLPNSRVDNLEDAFELYIAPSFYSEYAAASAEEDFLEKVERAKTGDLKPVNEVRLIDPDNTYPEHIFEIKTDWPNAERSARSHGFLGARLFHGEPRELPHSIVSVHLHCKKEDIDDESTWIKQTGAARAAAFRLGEERRKRWRNIVKQ